MTVNSEHMQVALQLARTNRDSKGNTLRNRVLLSPVGGGRLSVTCTDDTTETSVLIDGEIPETIAIAPQFCDLVQTLAPTVPIKINPLVGEGCKVQTGKSRFTLPANEGLAFPRFAEENEVNTVTISVQPKVLVAALSSAALGLGKSDPTKPYGSGVLFKTTPQGLILVGTNGFKLLTIGVAATTDSPQKSIQGLVPEKGIEQIRRLADLAGSDQIHITMGERQIKATKGSATVISRLISCSYPRFEQVLSVKSPVPLTLSKGNLLAILKRVGLFAPEKVPQVNLKLEGNKLSCLVATKQGECVESMDVDCPGQTAQACLNIGYLASLLEAMPEDLIKLDLADGTIRVSVTAKTMNAMGVVSHYKAG